MELECMCIEGTLDCPPLLEVSLIVGGGGIELYFTF